MAQGKSVLIATCLSASVGACFALFACQAGKAPFRQVQFCLAGAQETTYFVSFMDQIAQAHQMEFIDRSRQTEAELQSLAQANKTIAVAHPTTNISATAGSEFSFGMADFGTAPTQILVGLMGVTKLRPSSLPIRWLPS